jgi:hypothetical protein
VVLANPLTTRQIFIDVLEEQRSIASDEMERLGLKSQIKSILEKTSKI